MIDGSEKRNRQLAFELQNSHVCEKRSNLANLGEIFFGTVSQYRYLSLEKKMTIFVLCSPTP